MEKYSYTPEQRACMEGMEVPFAVYQFLDHRVVTLILSDGFCQLFGYAERAQAYYDMDHDMYKDAHPDDVSRIADAAVRFATEGGQYDVFYRTRIPDSREYRVVHALGVHFFTPEGIRLAQVWYTRALMATVEMPSMRPQLREPSTVRSSALSTRKSRWATGRYFRAESQSAMICLTQSS